MGGNWRKHNEQDKETDSMETAQDKETNSMGIALHSSGSKKNDEDVNDEEENDNVGTEMCPIVLWEKDRDEIGSIS